LWRWSRSRHPNRAKSWIKDRYWGANDTRDWIFAAEDEKLIFASDKEISRHWLIKFAANPYLKEYEDYYLKRKLS
jgi:RNA-directed DNA polymerase